MQRMLNDLGSPRSFCFICPFAFVLICDEVFTFCSRRWPVVRICGELYGLSQSKRFIYQNSGDPCESSDRTSVGGASFLRELFHKLASFDGCSAGELESTRGEHDEDRLLGGGLFSHGNSGLYRRESQFGNDFECCSRNGSDLFAPAGSHGFDDYCHFGLISSAHRFFLFLTK